MFIALREMRRAKLRFGLLTGAIGLLVFLILFQQALLGDLVTQFIGAVRNQSADVLAYSDQARRNIEGSVLAPGTVEAVAAVPGVASAGPLGQGTFTVTAGGKQVDAVLFGYELGGPGAPTTLVAGRLPTADNEAVASSDDRSEGFGIGDMVRIEPGGAEIMVVGEARDLRYSVAPTLFVSFDTYAAARRVRNPDIPAGVEIPASLVAVQVAEGADAASVARAINDTVAGVDAVTRQVAVDESPGVAAVRQSFSIILLLAYMVVTLVTGFFFLILTVQKARALTLLRAIGAPSGLLVRGLLVQVLAVVVGAVVVGWLLLLGASAGISSGLSLSVEPGLVLGTALVIIVLAVLASLGAVRRVLRIDPIEATTGLGVGS